MTGAGAEPRGAAAPSSARASSTSKGTPGSHLVSRITSEVFTEATLGAETRSRVRNFWKVDRSGATHFRMKSISPFSM